MRLQIIKRRVEGVARDVVLGEGLRKEKNGRRFALGYKKNDINKYNDNKGYDVTNDWRNG